MRLAHSLQVAGLAAGLALIAGAPAHAQNIPGVPSRGAAPVKRQAPAAAEVPPPALPGTMNQFAPADRTATDLSPTDALFDAINRGDTAAARDAINHGADLNAHNVLGMSPLDLSVDLSRNNITFLLLSLGAGDSPGARPMKASATTAVATKLPGTKLKPVVKVAAQRPVSVQPQLAGFDNPGTPVPQAGFLGFGGTTR